MASLDQAQERFVKALDELERVLAESAALKAGNRAATLELAELEARYTALQAEHAALQAAHKAMTKQHQSVVVRLDDAISGLHELLSV